MATNYPPAAFYFRVEFGLDGIQDNDSRFQELSGLSAPGEVNEIREGGENRFAYRLPKAVQYSNLVLKRGLISDSRIIAWINDILGGDLSAPIKPVDLIVTLMNEDNEPAASWKVENAYPVKFEVESFNAKSNEAAVEQIEFAYNRITRENV